MYADNYVPVAAKAFPEKYKLRQVKERSRIFIIPRFLFLRDFEKFCFGKSPYISIHENKIYIFLNTLTFF